MITRAKIQSEANRAEARESARNSWMKSEVANRVTNYGASMIAAPSITAPANNKV